MPITIGSNIASIRAQRVLANVTKSQETTFERLSSGMRINKSADDAAGLAVSQSLKTNARVFSQGIRNINDGISALNIADGAAQALTGVVIRIKELAEQAANGSYSQLQREALDDEAQALRNEYNRILVTTKFNDLTLTNGSTTNLTLQANGNSPAGQELALNFGALNGGEVGTGQAIALDGDNDYVEVAHTSDLTWRGGDLTVEGWFNVDSAETQGQFFSKTFHGGGVPNYRLGMDPGLGGVLVLQYQAEGATSGHYIRYDDTALLRDQWNHIAFVYDDAEGPKLFINGEQQAEYTHDVQALGVQADAGIAFAIGNIFPYGGASAPVFSFLGEVDQFRLSTTARYNDNFIATRSQVSSDQYTTLLLNFSAGSTLRDDSGRNHQVSLVGGASTTSAGNNPNTSQLAPFLLTSQADALDTLTLMDSVLANIGMERGKIGAIGSRLQTVLTTLQVSRENFLAAESRIADTDMAEESAKLVRQQILQQAGASVLAQANQQPALALRLLS